MPIAIGGAAVGLALLGFLILAASPQLADLLSGILARLPVIGPQLQRSFNFAVLDVIARVVVFSRATAEGLAQWVVGPFYSLWSMIDSLVFTDWKLSQKVWGVATVTIPRVVTWTWSAVTWALENAKAYTDQRVSATVSWTWSLYVNTVSYAQALTAQAEALASARADDVVRYADALYRASIGYAFSLYGKAIGYTQARVFEAERFAEAKALDALDAAEADIAREFDRARRVEGALGAELGQAVQDLVGDVAEAEARALAYAAGLVLPVATAVRALEDSPCQRFCSPLGELGQALQQIEDVGLVAAIVALAEAGARDSAGVGRALAQDLGGIARSLESDARSVVGL